MSLKENIKTLSEKYLSEIIQIRRHLHAHPELSFEEYNTSKFICEKLKEWGIPFKDGIVKTGIVAIIQGNLTPQPPLPRERGRCIALRADMDALPIIEANEVEYRSKNSGVMHACGHDVHTSALLGAAKILSELKNEFRGTIKLIFQPGEEKAPGGASLMIKEGVLENPKPSSIFAQHVFPSLETGKVGFRSGKYMASTDEIYLTVKGKGGHAAMKGMYVNPLLIASEILLSLEDGVSSPPSRGGAGGGVIPTVLAFGKITGNGATNVIPDEVKLEGTFRTMDEAWRKEAHALLRQIATAKAKSMGGDCEVNILTGYPALVNDEQTTGRAKKYAEDFLGKENVIELELRMTGEDFSFFAEKIPACFYRLGTGNKAKGIASGVHTPTFNIDESALKTGMGLMAWIAVGELKK